nr:hypothetical protein [Leptospira ilyithenensis]
MGLPFWFNILEGVIHRLTGEKLLLLLSHGINDFYKLFETPGQANFTKIVLKKDRNIATF